MRIDVQIISNNILQRVPCIMVKVKNYRYLFNTPEQHCRFLTWQYNKIAKPLKIFYTKYDSNTLGGLLPLIIEVYTRKKALDTVLYFDKNSFKYFSSIWFKLANQILHFSFCDMFSG